MNRAARIRFGVLAGSVVIIAIVAAALLGRVTYGVLYYNLPQAEAGAIIAALSERGVPYRTEGTGTILVPEEQVSELLMTLSSEGVYNSGGDLNFSILQSASGFGATDIERQAYLAFQYQDNIRRALLQLDKIENAMVLISLPEESSFVFSRDARDATASVSIEVKNGGVLTPAEAVAIGELVARAAPGLRPENVSIVDSALNLYSAIPTAEGEQNAASSDAAIVASQILLDTQVKQQLETSVINLLTPVFGQGRVKAGASVALEFDRETSESIEFAPPVEGETEGLVRSMERIYEHTREESGEGGVPGTDSNGMGSTEDIDGTDEYPYLELENGENYAKLLETINYEMNQTTTQLERARGTMKRLSIAVLVDSGVIEEDYTAEVRELVAKAVGVSEDSVAVHRLPITETESNVIADALVAQEVFLREIELRDLIKTLAICAAGLIALGLLLFTARGMIKSGGRGRADMVAATAVSGERLAADGSGYPLDYDAAPGYGDVAFDAYGNYDGMDGVSYVPGSAAPAGAAYKGVTGSELEDVDTDDQDVSVGGERPNTLTQLERMVEHDPKAVAQILRSWLTED
jgi:flagellar M-ring protein FliF